MANKTFQSFEEAFGGKKDNKINKPKVNSYGKTRCASVIAKFSEEELSFLRSTSIDYLNKQLLDIKDKYALKSDIIISRDDLQVIVDCKKNYPELLRAKPQRKYYKATIEKILEKYDDRQKMYLANTTVDYIKKQLLETKTQYVLKQGIIITKRDLELVLDCKKYYPELLKGYEDIINNHNNEIAVKAKNSKETITNQGREKKASTVKRDRGPNKKNDFISLYCAEYCDMSDDDIIEEYKHIIGRLNKSVVNDLYFTASGDLKRRIVARRKKTNSVEISAIKLLFIIREKGLTSKIQEKRQAPKPNIVSNAKISNSDTIVDSDNEGIAFEDFVIKGDSRKCIFNHDSVMIKASISLINRKGDILQKTVPAGFCPKCKSYFILQRDFDDISEYGIPLCQQFTKNEFRMYITGWRREFKEHSIINQMGYNVNAKDDLSRIQRQSILALALDRHIYTRAQLDNHIYKQIALRANNPSMENAIAKWEEDRTFIQQYKSGSMPVIGVKSITKRLIKKH